AALRAYFTKNPTQEEKASTILSTCEDDDARELCYDTHQTQLIVVPSKRRKIETEIEDENTQVIERFVTEALKTDLNEQVIVLPPLLKDSSEIKIYRRDCYDHIKEFILKSSPYNRFCITGNPGTGKTVFGFFMMSVLLQLHYRLLVDGVHNAYLVGFNRETGAVELEWILDDSHYAYRAKKDDVWCIIDSKKPRIDHDFSLGRFIMVSSPREEYIKNFNKYPHTLKMYMPIWTINEILFSN
ncbi:11001_t:CDS:2, partial [Paraglomus occultum]